MEPTYKGLKQQLEELCCEMGQGVEPTYKGLKQKFLAKHEREVKSVEPTYKGLNTPRPMQRPTTDQKAAGSSSVDIDVC